MKEFADLHKELLYGEADERQSYGWFKLLSFAKEVTAVTAATGKTVTCPVTLDGMWQSDSPYQCKALGEETVYLRLKDFADEEAIQKLYAGNDALLRSCRYLVIDVRNNGGGNDTAFLPLLEFCLPEGKTPNDLPDGIYDSGIEINYSERNCDSRLQAFARYKEMDLPEETRLILAQMEAELEANRGKGFLSGGSANLEFPYIGLALPKKVYIITDGNCGSSGDAFVDVMRKSDKVTVVGRPTMGILDFSNCTQVSYGDFVLMYPTSRALYLDNGIRMRGRGVPVDVYIPWTPAHLLRDMDLEKALELIAAEH